MLTNTQVRKQLQIKADAWDCEGECTVPVLVNFAFDQLGKIFKCLEFEVV